MVPKKRIVLQARYGAPVSVWPEIEVSDLLWYSMRDKRRNTVCYFSETELFFQINVA